MEMSFYQQHNAPEATVLKAAASTYLAHAGRDVHKEGMLLSNQNPSYPKRVKHKAH